jgi:hypothetical protein
VSTSQKSLETSNVAANTFVYYEGHLASFPRIMVGKLILNSRFLVFHIYEPRYAGVLQNARLTSTGRVLSLALKSIIDVTVEKGMRSRKSRPNWKSKDDFEKKSLGERAINAHPSFLDDSEAFATVMITAETGNGVEIATFEVQNPHALEQSLKNHIEQIDQIAKSTS